MQYVFIVLAFLFDKIKDNLILLESIWLKKTFVKLKMHFKYKLDHFVFGNGRITVLRILFEKSRGKTRL